MPDLIFPRPVAALALAAALLAAACGTETAPTLDTAAQTDSSSQSTTSEVAADTTEDAEVEGPGVEPTESDEAAADTTEPEPEIGNHLFPDLETVNVKDGANLNLATELAGGDTPVLLWFYAPH